MSIPTTFRLNEPVQEALERFSKIRKTTKNKLVNEALERYLREEAETLADDLGDVLKSLATYQKADPDYAKAIEAAASTEAAHGGDDPAEGVVEGPSSTSLSSRIENLLHG